MAKDPIQALAGVTFEELQECLALGASLDHVRDLYASGFGVAQIKQLAMTLGQAKTQGAGISAGDLRQILLDQRKAMKPENNNHPGISAFSYPEGDQARPKPPLRHTVYFNGFRERHEALTPTEVDLYNRFDGSRSARGGRWRAEVRRNGTDNELWITTDEARTIDGRQSMPAATLILRELLDGEAAANPDLLAARVADLEATIRSMAATQPAA